MNFIHLHPYTLPGRITQPTTKTCQRVWLSNYITDGLTNAETGCRKMHENLTNAKLHRLTEPFAKGSANRYFYSYLTEQAYGA